MSRKGWHAWGKRSRNKQFLLLYEMMVALVTGLIAGACIPVLRLLVYGSADPFDHRWPIYLQASSLVCAAVISCLLRRPFVAAIGLYGGLLAFMVASGEAGYPLSSAIALAVHGLVPAITGALVPYVLLRAAWLARRRPKVAQ